MVVVDAFSECFCEILTISKRLLNPKEETKGNCEARKNQPDTQNEQTRTKESPEKLYEENYGDLLTHDSLLT